MENPIIQTDLAQVLGQINQKLDKLSENVIEVKISQARLEGKVDSLEKELKAEIQSLEKDVTELKDSVKGIKSSASSQFWALIGVVFTAVIRLIGALGKMVFFPNP